MQEASQSGCHFSPNYFTNGLQTVLDYAYFSGYLIFTTCQWTHVCNWSLDFSCYRKAFVTRIIRNKTQSASLLCLHVGNNSNSIYLLIMLAKAIKMGLQSAAQEIDDRNWPRAAESPNDSSFNLKDVVGNRPSG